MLLLMRFSLFYFSRGVGVSMCVKVKVYNYAIVRVVAIHNTSDIFWRHRVYRKAKQTGHTNVNHWENKTLTGTSFVVQYTDLATQNTHTHTHTHTHTRARARARAQAGRQAGRHRETRG